MAKLRVTIIDEVKDRRLKVDLPDDAAVEKLLPALAKKLGLPPAAYRLTHEAMGRVLGGDQTLASFGVGEGETLRLAAAREEAPAVPEPAVEVKPVEMAEEEAVSIWQKVPVWGWGAIAGVVLLVAVVGAFLAGRGAKPVPTPTVVAEVATPTVTSPAMPRPTATPVAPTSTPLPPTDMPVPPTATPVPLTDTPVRTDTPVPPTDTPMPTATPQPTPTPTPTMDADPTVYDNFNNSAFDGGVQTGLWKAFVSPPSRIEQQNGVVVFTLTPGAGKIASLFSVENLKSNQFNFVESKLLLSSEKTGRDGDIGFGLVTTLKNGQDLIFLCLIYRQMPVQVGCEVYGRGDQAEYLSDRKITNYDVWHTVRIEMDPEINATFYIDGQQVGSYIPNDAEEIKGNVFTPRLEVWSPMQDGIKAQFDDVRIGPVQ